MVHWLVEKWYMEWNKSNYTDAPHYSVFLIVILNSKIIALFILKIHSLPVTLGE